MRATHLFATLLLAVAPAAHAAEEPSGCDKFKWDIARERTALTTSDLIKLTSGQALTAIPTTALTLTLVPPGDAGLPKPPERAPQEGTLAAFISVTGAPKAGRYTVSLSAGAWVDIVQDGHFLRPKAFSGATDCEGIRKTMKYELAGSPFTLQISGARDRQISIAILPSE